MLEFLLTTDWLLLRALSMKDCSSSRVRAKIRTDTFALPDFTGTTNRKRSSYQLGLVLLVRISSIVGVLLRIAPRVKAIGLSSTPVPFGRARSETSASNRAI